jgi:hypothetical protein
MTISAELSALVGVVIGAVLSFAATYVSERATWFRNQAVRWDERRLSAYADYSNAVKDVVALACRIAAGRGFDTTYEPLDPGPENLAKLAEAAARRTVASETLRLLTDAETMMAATEMTRHASRLEGFARGSNRSGTPDWHGTYARYEEARDEYITCARRSLKVTGPHLLPNRMNELGSET